MTTRWPLWAAVLLSACATTAPGPGEQPWTNGRISVRVEASALQVGRNLSAVFELRASNDDGELRLSTPLGNRLATLRWAPDKVSLLTYEGERRFANLDELSRQALGESLPLAALPDWIAGRPWPGAAHSTTDAGFAQLGWQVTLTRRTDGVIDMRRPGPPAVSIRVIVDDLG